MKKITQLLSLVFFGIYYSQEYIEKFIPDNYELLLKKECDYNSDKKNDYILILSKKNETNFLLEKNNISKRKFLILKNIGKNTYQKVFDSEEIVPCRECSGKSDNIYSDISFKSYVFKYTTANYPFEKNGYYISTYTLKFEKNDFALTNYDEKFYENAEDENPIKISLLGKDFENKVFNFYSFNFGDNRWQDLVNVNNDNVLRINNIAFQYEKKNEVNNSIILLEKILKKYPMRVVAWLNLADVQWQIGERSNAKTSYQKYFSLMKSKEQRSQKIPERVYERIK
jgi:hypothetical protein